MSDNKGTTGAGASQEGAEKNQAAGQPASPTTDQPSAKSRGGKTRSGRRPPGGGDVKGDKPRRRWPFVLAILIVLILALGAIGGDVYLWLFGSQNAQRQARQLSDVHQQVRHQSREIGQHGESISRIGKLADTQRNLLQHIQSQRNALNKLQQRVKETAKETRQLNQLVRGGRQVWLLGEVEELLYVANDLLSLREDVPGALHALKIAQMRLGAIADPSLIDVRKRLSDEITALQAVPNMDVEGMALSLSSLSKRVPQLPLKQSVPRNYQTSGSGQVPGNKPWWQRFWISVGQTFSGMFNIRRVDKPAQPLLPPKEEFFLYRNLQLKLESARLALLQRHNGVFHNSVATARHWLLTYFKNDASGVQSMARTLNKMQQKNINPKLPDISDSLTLLRKKLEAMGEKQ